MRKRTLSLKRETIRTLAGPDLLLVAGGIPTESNGPEPCIPVSYPQGTCTGCHSINATCNAPCGSAGTCDGCTLWTFGIKPAE